MQVSDFVTFALIDFLQKKEKEEGEIVLPEHVLHFTHLNTEITHSCKDSIQFSNG